MVGINSVPDVVRRKFPEGGVQQCCGTDSAYLDGRGQGGVLGEEGGGDKWQEVELVGNGKANGVEEYGEEGGSVVL